MGIHYVVIFLSHTKAYRFWRTLWLITNGCIMDHQVTAVILSAVVLRTTGYLTLNLLYQGCHKILTKRCRKDIAIFFNWKKSKVTMFIVILNNNSYRHWRFRTLKSSFLYQHHSHITNHLWHCFRFKCVCCFHSSFLL